MKHIFVIALLFVLLMATAGAQGGTTGGSPPPIPNLTDPLGNRSITQILESIANFLAFRLAPPLVAILIIVGALQMIFAAGSSEKIQTGRRTIFWAVIGFLIVLMASGIATLIENVLSGR